MVTVPDYVFDMLKDDHGYLLTETKIFKENNFATLQFIPLILAILYGC